ncbi:hypothetical protein [Streptomyces albus]|uniref:hypothetical protein n=1 Tax=Streptomyces albus TaxID=1888 RepID=UPI000A69F9B6|nr:hypothetical protein [Streptomyces albus]
MHAAPLRPGHTRASSGLVPLVLLSRRAAAVAVRRLAGARTCTRTGMARTGLPK